MSVTTTEWLCSFEFISVFFFRANLFHLRSLKHEVSHRFRIRCDRKSCWWKGEFRGIRLLLGHVCKPSTRPDISLWRGESTAVQQPLKRRKSISCQFFSRFNIFRPCLGLFWRAIHFCLIKTRSFAILYDFSCSDYSMVLRSAHFKRITIFYFFSVSSFTSIFLWFIKFYFHLKSRHLSNHREALSCCLAHPL